MKAPEWVWGVLGMVLVVGLCVLPLVALASVEGRL